MLIGNSQSRKGSRGYAINFSGRVKLTLPFQYISVPIYGDQLPGCSRLENVRL